jgi:hydrogenase expression/formation protein HypD
VFSLNDKKLAKEIITKIKKKNLKLKLMHVCGTHQDTLVKNGLDFLLDDCGIKIGQGPGCPVCVTSPKEIEEMIVLAEKGKIVTTFGDMIRVPGEKQSLNDLKTDGYNIKAVYSIEDAISIANKYKNKEIVFMAVGFETTAPTTASALLRKPPDNFSILCCHRTIPYALKAILDLGELKINGLIEPGHVSAIIGKKPYDFISLDYNIPQVIAGFEPIDILMSVLMIIRQIENNKYFVENEYSRVVKSEGNIKAKKAMNIVFKDCDVKWRGFPIIQKSGLKLKNEFEGYDSRKKFQDDLEELNDHEFKEPPGCRCGELLRGLISPKECPLFGVKCYPDNPIGPCMVSIEGSCNIEYRYLKK